METRSNPATDRAAAPRQSGFNRFMIRWLTSPLGVLSGGVALVRYTGRVSGERRELPVQASRYENCYLIRVGRPERKRWWRNFLSPRPVELVRGRTILRGTAVVVTGESERGRRLAADYFAQHHGAARRAGLPRLDKGEIASPEALDAASHGLVFVVATPAS